MKQKKILKAINEGIRKSLLQFNDIEFNQSTNVKQKISKNLKDWKWIQYHFVDLNLPSGTLWCKHNLGAVCNKDINTWYGNYYMWGSTYNVGDEFCSWCDAPFNNGYIGFSNRIYFNEHRQEFMDGDNLQINYDIAYHADGRMEMPTMENLSELFQNTSNEWIENYNGILGLNGRVFTGNNGNSIFMPASGSQEGSNVNHTEDVGYIWSKSLSTNDISSAMAMAFDIDRVIIYKFNRCTGFPIRPICNM